MARAAKDSGETTVESLLASVRGARFAHTSGFREGYDISEVDIFLGALEVALGRRSPVDRLIASVEFTPVRMRKGYDTSEVDGFLADFDERAATLLRPTSDRDSRPEASPTDEAIELVQHARFTTVRRLGYKIDQVDALLDQLVEALQSGSALQDVLDRRPPSRTLAGEGYAVNEVEKLLSSLGLHRPSFSSTGLDLDPAVARDRSAPSSAPAEKHEEEHAEQGEHDQDGPHDQDGQHDQDGHGETTSVLDDLLTHEPPRPTRRTGTGARRRRSERRERREPVPEPAVEPTEALVVEPAVEPSVEPASEPAEEPAAEPAPESAEEAAEGPASSSGSVSEPPVDAVPTPALARTFEVTLHAVDPVGLCTFWCEVLRYRVDPPAEEHDPGDVERSVAVPKAGDGPRLTFVRVPRRRGGLVRVRLDVVVAPELTGDEHAAAIAEEAARLVALGATAVQRQDGAGDRPSGAVALRDPEGNEFSLV